MTQQQPTIIMQRGDIVMRRGFTADLRFSAGPYIEANGWSARWDANGAGKSVTVALALGTDGADWMTTLTAADTTGYPLGVYAWEAIATRGSEVRLFATGRLTVQPSVAAGDATADGQTWAEKALAAVETALLSASGSGEITVSVEGFNTTFESRLELLQYRGRLRHEVDQERRAARTGRGDSGTVRVRPARRAKLW